MEPAPAREGTQQQQQDSNLAQQPSPAPAAPDAPPPASLHVLHGTCGWSDASLVQCRRFYPPGVRSTEDKLRHYSRHFGCVEVDTSCYAIPRPAVTARWAAATAPGFTFHVKAFGLFAAGSCQVSALPPEARALLPPAQQAQPAQHVRLGSPGLPAAAEDACWAAFHAACEPLRRAGRLGCVLFQFHLSFTPSQANLQHILRCRRRLAPGLRMATELRCRAWLADPAWRAALCEALAAAGICLVSADELEHETAQKDREQTGLPPGAVRRVLPIALEVTQPAWHIVRVHRRHGTTDRLLPAGEVEAWAARLARQLAPRLRGPIFFLWGTDWEDVPIRNARNLDAALPPELRLDWRQRCRAAPPPPGSIANLFQRKAAAAAAEGSSQGAEQGCSGGSREQAPGAAEGSKSAGATRLVPSGKRAREGSGAGEAVGRKSGGGSGGGILRFLQRPPAG